jgi:hypothetical protein
MAGIRDNLARQDNDPQPQPKRVPVNFENQDDFLADMRKKYEWGFSFDEHNVLAGKEDAKFTVGNQWDPVVEQRRKNQKKPVLTFNRLVAFMAQLVGNRLMNETEIRVFPDKAGTKEIATIREGLIRSIFKNSNADFARDEAGKYQVVGGVGYFSLCMEYASDDVFEQEIKLQAVVDPYSVVMDPLGIEPSGEDCQWGFISDDIPQQDYQAPLALGFGSQASRVKASLEYGSGYLVALKIPFGSCPIGVWSSTEQKPSRSTSRRLLFTTSRTRKNSSMSSSSKHARTAHYTLAKFPSASRSFTCARAMRFSKVRLIIRFRQSRFIACQVGSLNDGDKIHRWGLDPLPEGSAAPSQLLALDGC